MADAITPMISKTFIEASIKKFDITRVYLNNSAGGGRKIFLDLSSVTSFPALLIFNDDPRSCIGITATSPIWSDAPSEWPGCFVFHFDNLLILASNGDMIDPYDGSVYGKYQRYFGTAGNQYVSGNLDMTWDIRLSFRSSFVVV
jgi:hypothetical protein